MTEEKTNEVVALETSDVSTLVLDDTQLSSYSQKYGMDALQLQAIMKTYGKGMDFYDFNLFLSKAREYDLSIQRGEIWGFKDSKGNMVMFAGRDGFLTLAQRNPKYRGLRSAEVRKNDVFVMDIANGKIKHEFNTEDRGDIIGAYAIAYAADSEPVIEWVDMKTYNKGYNTWKSHPAEMIKKVAEVHALKKQFGVSGLYAREEADSMGMAKAVKPVEEEDNEHVLNLKEEIHNAESVEHLDEIATQINQEKKKGLLSKTSITELLQVWVNKKNELNAKQVPSVDETVEEETK